LNPPNNILLNKIVPKNLYYDKKSKELVTNTIKPKYKLAGNSIPELEMYFFYVFTKRRPTGKLRFIFAVAQADWENRIPGPYLREPISYCDLKKYELLDAPTLIGKCKDKENGFPYIAKLNHPKYQELRKIQTRIGKYPFISHEAKSIINRGWVEKIDQITSKLDI
jgi:hypothetical protein